MRFEFYTEQLEKIPKLSVDGIVPNSIHFSHWEGNETPAEVKADTSTEIALKLIGSLHTSALTRNIDLVTNNHFDTDGVLSVWTMLNPARATEYRDVLVAAAEAGDFSEYSSDAGVRISLSIQGSDQAAPDDEAGSPLAAMLAGEQIVEDQRAYQLVLPEIERLLTRIDDYEPLWRKGWAKIAKALESFARGASHVIELNDAGVSLITLAPEIFSGAGFNPTRHVAPFTAISHHARGTFYIIATPATGGWFYRFDYPYYSWAETIVRPRVTRRNLERPLQILNDMENSSEGTWRIDKSEMTSAAKFVDQQGMLAVSHLAPDIVAEVFAREREGVAS